MRALLASVVILAACSWDSARALETPTSDNPCGGGWVECATQKSCCVEGTTCGGEPASVGCPAGQCCAIGGMGAALDLIGSFDAGPVPEQAMTPQRPFR
jgi:hypothetical protein